jgi:hypothetical protein
MSMTQTSGRYDVLLSGPISREMLRDTLDGLRRNYSSNELETWTAEKIRNIPLVGRQLRPLTAIGKIFETIWLRSCAVGIDCDSQFEEICQLCDRNKYAGSSIMWLTLRNQAVPKTKRMELQYDLSFAGGLAQDGYWTQVLVSSDSELRKDREQRKQLFEKAVRQWGLDGNVEIVSRGNDFTITTRPPFGLQYLEKWPHDLNPTDFRVSGLSSLQQVISATRAARDELSAEVVEALLGCNLSREQYEQIYSSLNALHRGWHVEVLGSLTREAEDILNGGEITDSSPSWIPAFFWWEDDAYAKVYVSLIVENGERLLEVATDRGTSELLQERVAFLDNIRFHQVFP